MTECGGVLVPDGDGWRRTCFVEERGLASALAYVIWKDGRHPLQMTNDHYLPVSHWPESKRLHKAHLYCQCVQGRQIGNANGRASKGGYAAAVSHTAEQRFQIRSAGRATLTAEHRLQISRIANSFITAEQRKHNGRSGMHTRWHVNLRVVSPDCSFCVGEL